MYGRFPKGNFLRIEGKVNKLEISLADLVQSPAAVTKMVNWIPFSGRCLGLLELYPLEN